jgi:hypothetical protein
VLLIGVPDGEYARSETVLANSLSVVVLAAAELAPRPSTAIAVRAAAPDRRVREFIVMFTFKDAGWSRKSLLYLSAIAKLVATPPAAQEHGVS